MAKTATEVLRTALPTLLGTLPLAPAQVIADLSYPSDAQGVATDAAKVRRALLILTGCRTWPPRESAVQEALAVAEIPMPTWEAMIDEATPADIEKADAIHAEAARLLDILAAHVADQPLRAGIVAAYREIIAEWRQTLEWPLWTLLEDLRTGARGWGISIEA